MKIQFKPTVDIKDDDIDRAIDALMIEHGMPKAGAIAYLIKSMEHEAKIAVRNLIAELNQIKHD
jgi:hypothetical protein